MANTIASVASQDYVDYEHLVVDGLSTDETMDIVRSSPSVTRYLSELDAGLYDAMNKGISLANGDIVGFLNSDDMYADSSVLEKVAQAFEDSSVDVCYGDLVYVSEDNARVVRYWKSKDFVSGAFGKGWCPAHPTFYVRKSKIAELGLFNLSYKLAADVEFMMRYLEGGHLKCVYIPHVLVRMRVGGATNQSWRNVVMQNKEVLAALRKNNIPFSRFLFFGNKLVSRLLQFVNARLNQKRWP
jgi:glycosyltransferase involved in cell wall biosynthesis